MGKKGGSKYWKKKVAAGHRFPIGIFSWWVAYRIDWF